MTTIRASSLNLARTCGHYAVLAIQGRTRGTAATSAGTDLHTLCEAHLLGLPWPDVSNPEVIPEAQAWAAWWDALGLGAPTATEVAFSLDVLGDVTVTGHADAVWDDEDADTVVIVDWKRDMGFYKHPAIEDDAQLATYGIMAREHYGRSKAIVMRVHIPGLELHSTEIDDDGEWLAMIESVARDPSATVGTHCEGCLSRQACTPYQDRASLLPVLDETALTDESASKAIIALGAAKALCKRVEAALKQHVNDGGTIEADGKTWRPSHYSTTRIDGNAAFRRLHALTGADPMEHASIGKGALVKALKSADVDVDEVLTAMAEAGETKESPAVRWAWRSK